MAGTDIDVQLIDKGLNVVVNSQKSGMSKIGQRFTEMYEDFVKKSSRISRRNIRRIDSLNKEFIKRLKG